MKNILLINLGTPFECFISTALINGLYKKYDNPSITVLVSDNKNCIDIYRFNKKINRVITFSKVDIILSEKFDVLINLSSDFNTNINSKEKFGFNFTNCDNIEKILKGNKRTNKNLFQIYFNIADVSWRGEGINLSYFPKTKVNKNRTGIFISDLNVKKILKENLLLEKTKPYIVKYKDNIFKRIDEINKFNYIITDDLFCAYICVLLKRTFFFLKDREYNFSIETFSIGDIIEVKNFINRF